MANYDTVRSAYLKFPDRSDFAPAQKDDGTVIIYYSGEKGLQKAQMLGFSLGITPVLEQAEKHKIYELLEGLGGEVDDVGSGSEDDFGDETVNILTSSYDDAPVIKLVNQIIIHAVKSGASDIHFEGRDNAFLVRLRVDGRLTTFRRYPKSVHEPIVARIKVIASLDVAETRRTQDGRINLKIGNRSIDIRVSCMPSVNGEKLVLRILERSTDFATLEQVGLEGKTLDMYRPYLDRPNGIILVTGPTGSGKTTTLYASLLAMNRESKNVLTVEDPVEYHIDNITQVQVNLPANITFANAIRAFLRQDPDIILVGEIRDNVTAEAAVQASLTGHLVLSTLHTNDAPTAVSRLIEMDVEPFLISSSLLLVMGQRLVRKICPLCKQDIKADDVIKKFFGDVGVNIDVYMKGKGCEHCFQTGYRGRVGIFEILTVNDDIRRLVNRSASAFEIREEARKHGFQTMFEHGVELIRKGQTTPEELLSVTRSE
ncbi:MAG: GspE/PulE family protein [Deferribacteraceae bacterium]|jgi:general secretion pathway protein E|nr:GspE/PulE family protein [Deferribacteraceae bacterium]